MSVVVTPTVLVVEDHDDARQLCQQFLEFGGYSVVTATNGREALDKVERGLRPCIILLDVMMPIMDGPTFAEHLRAMPDDHLSQTPIVLLTGAHDTQSAAQRAGALEVIHKPVAFDYVVDVVGQHCRR
jgi:CheY-like chemotaxis protein